MRLIVQRTLYVPAEHMTVLSKVPLSSDSGFWVDSVCLFRSYLAYFVLFSFERIIQAH